MGRANRTSRVKARTLSMLAGWTQEAGQWSGRIHVGGKVLTPAKILSRLTKSRDRHRQVELARAALAQALAARDRELDQEQRFQENLTLIVRLAMGNNLTRLSRYGVGPIKRRGKLSAEATAIAEGRRMDTRKVRGVTGKRQREAITTEAKLQVVVVEPVAASSPSDTSRGRRRP